MLLSGLLTGCGEGEEGAPVPVGEASPENVVERSTAGERVEARFVDVAAEVGLSFEHFNGMTGEFYYSELMGGGTALFDFDNDGDLDLFVTQGHLFGAGKVDADAVFPWEGAGPPLDRLFENQLESGSLRFVDVTDRSGIVGDGYSMGVAAGDYDGDGWVDLYVTEWAGSNRMYRNRGDGTFEEVGQEIGVTDDRWGISAAFLDFDRDGRLDLFLANYIDYTLATHKECTNDIGLRDYCGPASYRAVPDVLFHNEGDGTFRDVSSALGINRESGGGMGVVVLDYNDDGWLDLYVANDEMPNHLWENDAGTGFQNRALLAGAAVNQQGHAEAGMGVDSADLDRDGDEDVFVAHLEQETNTFYRNSGDSTFEDWTTKAELGLPSWDFTSFGAGFFDFDRDGWLDIFVANGAVKADRIRLSAGEPHPLDQKNQLFRNLGDGTFAEYSSQAGPVFELEEVSRGAAFGDVDNDGDVDIVVHNNAGPLRLLRNDGGAAAAWIGFRVLEVDGVRDAYGARVEWLSEEGVPQILRVGSDGSYASSQDPRALFGLGASTNAPQGRVLVTWIDGTQESWAGLSTGAYHRLVRGTGTALEGGS